MTISPKATDTLLENLGALLEFDARTMAALRAERDDALDKLKYARVALSNIEAERKELLKANLETMKAYAEAEGRITTLQALIADSQRRVRELLDERVVWRKKLAQANGRNDLLRDQNTQLQAELKARKIGLSLLQWDKIVTKYGEATAKDLAADLGLGSRDWRKTVATNLAAQQMTADEVRQQAIADSAEPQFTAQQMSDAKAVNEAQAEYERTARGEPTTEDCPKCGGTGQSGPYKCLRCGGGGRVLVRDDAPQHLDTEREGAADHAMSLDDDTD